MRCLSSTGPRVVIHIATRNTNTFCGRRVWVAFTLRWIIRNYGFATRFLSLFVCRDCSEVLLRSFQDGMVIR